MKTILCYIVAMLISIFEGIDTICSAFITRSIDVDSFIDTTRATSMFGFSYTSQLVILGIAAIIMICGIICDREVGLEYED